MIPNSKPYNLLTILTLDFHTPEEDDLVTFIPYLYRIEGGILNSSKSNLEDTYWIPEETPIIYGELFTPVLGRKVFPPVFKALFRIYWGGLDPWWNLLGWQFPYPRIIGEGRWAFLWNYLLLFPVISWPFIHQ